MISKRIVCAALLAACSSPALADKYLAVTPSGAAEMLFAEKPQVVVGKLSSRCIDLRWTVITSTSNEVTCEAPLNFGQSILGQALMGNSYSTPPRRFFRFNVAEVSGVSRVQPSGWIELQMAFGQTKRNDFSGPEFQNGALSFLGAAGGKLPVGTTFPNHVFMGVESDDTKLGKYNGLRVRSIQPNSPAEKAGMKTGDVIARVANKRFKNSGDFLDATAKALEMGTYPVEVFRGGKTVTLSLAAALRPTWTEQVIAIELPPAPRPAALAPTASVADELAKLAKLKADGVITDAEFDTQKRKVLGE